MIYLLEDDSAIRELVVYTLCSTGLEATASPRPRSFMTPWSAPCRSC